MSSPCDNGGVCNAKSNGSYDCTCPLGFTGDVCDQGEFLLDQTRPREVKQPPICFTVISFQKLMIVRTILVLMVENALMVSTRFIAFVTRFILEKTAKEVSIY